MQDYREFLEEVLISEKDIQRRVVELGAEISKDYAGQDLILVCILRGGVMFLTDLMRHITVPHMLEFLAVSSYGVGARRSSGQSRITLDVNVDIHDRNVLLIEDIVDSGYTIKAVLELLSARQPRSLKVCALLDKADRREVEVPLDYSGFVIADKFVFGYGLDADEYYRNLPFIGVLSTKLYKPNA
ncbi:MAG TPA: hypoxanthine phosphoribosyltransferase [Anaerolineales bacterium]|nr:hypoxanthine phosphoribosyltransferase [Anaerolineales bacterium]